MAEFASTSAALTVCRRIEEWIAALPAPDEPWTTALARSKADAAVCAKRLKALAGSKKAKAVAEREALARDEAARAEAFRALWLGRSAALVASLGALRAELAPELARLDAECAAARDALARLAPGARAAAARIFYDGTPDRAFSNFAPFALRPLGGLDLAKGEKLFHLVKVTLCGDADCAWRVLQTNDAPALRALGREAAGYENAVAAGWDDVDSHWLLLVCLLVKLAACARAENAALRRELVASARLYVAEGARDDRRCGIGFHATDGAPLEHVDEWGRNALGHACMGVARYLAHVDEAAGAVPDAAAG